MPAGKQAASQIGQAFRTLPLPTDTVWLSGAFRVRKICQAIASYSHETYPYPSESFALYSKQSTILPTKFKLKSCTILNKLFMNRLSGLFHKKIHSLWNRPESLLSENGARCEFKSTIGFNQKIAIPGALNWGGRHQNFALPS
jgi:hypothetical protein